MKCTSKTGALVAMKAVSEESELMLVTRSGNLIRIPASGISVIGRNTQGVRLIRLREADSISDVSYIAGEE
jgi:DNA gyrase subunit A